MNSECEVSARSRAAVEDGWLIWEGRSEHKIFFNIVGVSWVWGSGWFAELMVGVASLRTVAQQRGGQAWSWSKRDRGPHGEAVADVLPA